MRPSQLDYARLALGHWVVSRKESEEAKIALAFFVRNLFTVSRLTAQEICRCLWDLAPSLKDCHQGYLAACQDLEVKNSLDHLRAAFASDGADPTGLALRAHRHDENPGWAGCSRPTTLIGPWIFYRPPD